ncbi:hypothetical protein ACFWY9_13825 [Amycolatopsis sp. NPDC059027]|uniref:hypothetical protein n=1 Tax=unclassified Amycolatopsis TaxID=2618356 RepID=UPI0036735BCB
MAGRGWRKECISRTVDMTGREIEITTGVTRSPIDGQFVAVIAFDDRPTLLLDERLLDLLDASGRHSIQDALNERLKEAVERRRAQRGGSR